MNLRLRRICFIGVLPLVSSNTDHRAAVGVLLALCSIAIYGEMKPFQDAMTNILAHVAQVSQPNKPYLIA
jgi:hypothetical protein